MSAFWSDITRQLKPYTPGEQPRVAGLVKLNTNENPYPPSSQAMAALELVTAEQLRRYPDPACSALREVIAEREGIEPEQVFVGNGSDEVLAHVYHALLGAKPRVGFPDVTYSFYPVWAQLYQLEVSRIPLADDFTLDLDALSHFDGPLLLANPNAPTGIAITRAQVETLLAARPERLVVIDEAYFGFGAETCAPLILKYPNLLVTRTLSKSHALAGLRLGYALASTELIEGLERVKDSFNSYPVDAVAQSVATAALLDVAWQEQNAQQVSASREHLAKALVHLGFDVLPSSGNFLFVRHSGFSGAALFEGLRADNILVRRWDADRIGEYLRISIGTEPECERLLSCLRGLLS